jgi:hypothetical protein
MLLRVALVRTEVSEESIASIIRMTRTGQLMLALTSNRSTLRRNTVVHIHYIVFLLSVLLLLVTANILPSWPVLDTLMMEAILSSETSVLTRATR